MNNIGIDYKTIYRKLRDDLNEQRLDENKPTLRAQDLAKIFKQMSPTVKISDGTMSNIENGHIHPSFEVLKCYHDYFKVPYETLMGEGGIAKKPEHMIASAELGLSDEALDTIKSLPPDSLEMLNALIGNNKYTVLFLQNMLMNLHKLYELCEELHEQYQLEERASKDLFLEIERYVMKREALASSMIHYLLDKPYNSLRKKFKRIDVENEYLAAIPPEELLPEELRPKELFPEE